MYFTCYMIIKSMFGFCLLFCYLTETSISFFLWYIFNPINRTTNIGTIFLINKNYLSFLSEQRLI